MNKFIIFFICFLISGCSHFHTYQPSIEQGNIMTNEMVNQLHTGMNTKQVIEIMGNPVLTNTFDDNRINYVYTFKSSKGKTSKKILTLTFKNGVLAKIDKNF